jgi:hypothetical protein
LRWMSGSLEFRDRVVSQRRGGCSVTQQSPCEVPILIRTVSPNSYHVSFFCPVLADGSSTILVWRSRANRFERLNWALRSGPPLICDLSLRRPWIWPEGSWRGSIDRPMAIIAGGESRP